MLWRKRYTLSNTVVTPAQILSETKAHGCHNVITDTEYLTVSDSFLIEVNRLFKKEMRKWGLSYSSSFDCDNYSFEYMSIANKLYASNPIPYCQGIACGIILYRSAVAKAHALNFIINEDYECIPIEPQLIGAWNDGKTELSPIDWSCIKGIVV